MIEKLKRRYALSDKGASDMIKSSFCVAFTNIVLMLPVAVLYILIKDLMDGTFDKGRIPLYAGMSIVILILIAVANHIQYNSSFLATYTESGVRRIGLAEKIRKLPLSFFGKKDLTDLTSTMMGDCTQIETASSHWIPELFGALISTALLGITLFVFFDWRMALACFWVIPVSFLAIFMSSGVQKKAAEQNSAAQLELEDGVQECLEAVSDIRVNNYQEKYMAGLDKKIDNVKNNALDIEVKLGIVINIASIILKLGIGTTAFTGGVLLADGKISVLTFFFFLMIVSRIYDPMQITLSNFAAIILTETQCDRLNEILDHEVQGGKQELTNKGYDIVFDNVSFSYDDETEVLKGVSFTAKQGEVTALIGESGGGKTTVSKLAARFWDVKGGTIKIGGMDISEVDPETLSSLFAFVFQDVTLFNNTIKENILIGKKDATDEEIRRAAHMARCDEFIDRLPDGWDTVIGENGKELSGGERQRISIARALLKDAPIILLDEATASLDVENETVIQQALSELIKDKTVMIIAHRMRTIADADHVVVLSGGYTAEEGTPAELIKKNGIFKRMTEMQLVSQNWKI